MVGIALPAVKGSAAADGFLLCPGVEPVFGVFAPDPLATEGAFDPPALLAGLLPAAEAGLFTAF